MSSIHQTVAHRRTLTEMCDLRDQVVEELTAADAHRQEANRILEGLLRRGLDGRSEPYDCLERQIDTLDHSLWLHAFHLTGIDGVMDRRAHEEMEREMRNGKVPAFTIETVRNMFASLAQDADTMFRRGVAELFASLSADYRRHEAFRVAPKIICRMFVRPRFASPGMQVNDYARDQVNDLDRVMCAIQGRKFQPRALESAMNQAFIESGEYRDDRIRAIPFKNQNLHLHFLDTEILDGINRAIAQHYGEVLAREAA